MNKKGHPSDEVWSAPESGTVRDDTSGNNPSNRGNDEALVESCAGRGGARAGDRDDRDDPAVDPEER
jgi:hypothetical protein